MILHCFKPTFARTHLIHSINMFHLRQLSDPVSNDLAVYVQHTYKLHLQIQVDEFCTDY